MDDALAFSSPQRPARHSKRPALRETPRSAFGIAAVQADARPKVNFSPGLSRQVPVSNVTIRSTVQAPLPISVRHTSGNRTIREGNGVVNGPRGWLLLGRPPQLGSPPLVPAKPCPAPSDPAAAVGRAQPTDPVTTLPPVH